MTDIQVKATAAKRCGRIMLRMAAVLLVAAIIGAVLNRLSSTLDQSMGPAGFRRGVLQGALMPMSMPNLLVGRDVTIYAQNNTGVSYKLGYTAGVNGCGAIFFGFFFWRVNRWRHREANRAKP